MLYLSLKTKKNSISRGHTITVDVSILSLLSILSPTPVSTPRRSVTIEFIVPQASIEAMIANPSASVAGLREGIAAALGVDPSAVIITRTVPDLQSGQTPAVVDGTVTRLALTVDFEIVEPDAEVAAKLDDLESGDSSVVANLTNAVEQDLAAKNVAVTVEDTTTATS